MSSQAGSLRESAEELISGSARGVSKKYRKKYGIITTQLFSFRNIEKEYSSTQWYKTEKARDEAVKMIESRIARDASHFYRYITCTKIER